MGFSTCGWARVFEYRVSSCGSAAYWKALSIKQGKWISLFCLTLSDISAAIVTFRQHDVSVFITSLEKFG
jgi:hypothetical protein